LNEEQIKDELLNAIHKSKNDPQITKEEIKESEPFKDLMKELSPLFENRPLTKEENEKFGFNISNLAKSEGGIKKTGSGKPTTRTEMTQSIVDIIKKANPDIDESVISSKAQQISNLIFEKYRPEIRKVIENTPNDQTRPDTAPKEDKPVSSAPSEAKSVSSTTNFRKTTETVANMKEEPMKKPAKENKRHHHSHHSHHHHSQPRTLSFNFSLNLLSKSQPEFDPLLSMAYQQWLYCQMLQNMGMQQMNFMNSMNMMNPMYSIGMNQANPKGTNQMPPMGMNQMPPMGMNQMTPMGMNQMTPMGMNQMTPMGMNQMPPMGMNPANPMGMNQANPMNQKTGQNNQKQSPEYSSEYYSENSESDK